MADQSNPQGHPHVEETYQQGYEAQNNDIWDRDLNSDGFAGCNHGAEGQQARGTTTRTGYDVNDAHRRLNGLGDDDLKHIPIVAAGARLEQGATYINLLDDRREFSATGDMTAGESSALVAKTEVDYQLWNRLTGVSNPERIGEADDD